MCSVNGFFKEKLLNIRSVKRNACSEVTGSAKRIGPARSSTHFSPCQFVILILFILCCSSECCQTVLRPTITTLGVCFTTLNQNGLRLNQTIAGLVGGYRILFDVALREYMGRCSLSLTLSLPPSLSLLTYSIFAGGNRAMVTE